MKNILKISLFSAVCFSTATFTGCKKEYLNKQPYNQITEDPLFEDTKSAYYALNGINRMMSERWIALTEQTTKSVNDWGAKTIDLTSDIMGNDVVLNNSPYEWFTGLYQYTDQLRANYRVCYLNWAFTYKVINMANLILERIDGVSGPQEEKNDIKGQAYAYRAWAYTKLVEFYCKTYIGNENSPGVPIYTSSTVGTDRGNPRGILRDNFTMINADLDNAVSLLQGVTGRPNDKSNITLAIAQGLSARVALLTNDWTKARDMASDAITNSSASLMDSAAYRGGFTQNTNVEFMWTSVLTPDQTQSFGNNSFISFVDAAAANSYAGAGTYKRITRALLEKISTDDVRRYTFDASRNNTKFRLVDPAVYTWDVLYMRLAEMYLIKAEAEARLGDGNAVNTLEELVTKRNPNYSFASTPYSGGSDLLQEILLQRRIELWLEGFSYTDIQRLKIGLDRPTGTGNHSLGSAFTLTMPAGDNRFLFKVPQREIDANENITSSDQNPD